jgi:6,7-dimethyl-8-ribityllumazine synthase
VLPANIVVESVPGSYELPLACQRVYAASQIQSTTSTIAGTAGGLISATTDLLGSTSLLDKASEKADSHTTTETGGSKQPFDAVIAIGVLIKGETMHFEYISSAVSHGIMAVSADTGVPVTFGVLTTLTEEQAIARAADGPDNKGREAAWAAVEMSGLVHELGDGAGHDG